MQEQNKQVQVTLEKLTLNQSDVNQIYLIADEMPHKYARQIIGFIEDKVKEQLQAKVDELQAQYQKELEAKSQLKVAPSPQVLDQEAN